MMKIAYIVNHDLSKQNGVTKKVLMQVGYWEKQGHEVKILCTNSSKANYTTNNIFFYKSFGRIIINKRIMIDLSEYNPDVIYYRYSIFGRTLNSILNKYNCIGEANTFEVEEFWLLLKKYKKIKYLVLWLSNKFLRPFIIRKSKALITVTHEMAKYTENSRYNNEVYGVPNGIDMSEYSTLKKTRSCEVDEVNVFFMGSPDQPWHGVDIIERLSIHLPNFRFHVVGLDGDSSDNIKFHGYLSSQDYLSIIESCDICIGSLALFRNGMREGSPLKVREYVALGFPVVLGYKDTSILDSKLNYPWAKFIDFEKNHLDEVLEEFKSFCIAYKDYILSEEDKYYFSLEYTEKYRLSLFEQVVVSNKR